MWSVKYLPEVSTDSNFPDTFRDPFMAKWIN